MTDFIFQGGAENLRFFQMSDAARARLQYFWTCHKGAKRGDRAFIYLTAPLSRICGIVHLRGEPFLNSPDMFDNPFMQEKICVEIAHVESFEPTLDLLTFKNLRRLFGVDWGWTRYPRGATKIPEAVAPPFLELVGRARQLTRVYNSIREVNE